MMNEKSEWIRRRLSAFKLHTMHFMSGNANFDAVKCVSLHTGEPKTDESSKLSFYWYFC